MPNKTNIPTTEKLTLGWCEYLSLPDLNIPSIKAKVDTGAKTSCLHAFNVEGFTRITDHDQNNTNLKERWVRFSVHSDDDDPSIFQTFEQPVFDERLVTDSGGHTENRYVIKLTVVLGKQHFDTQFTLTNRDTMQFKILLGRRALAGRYLVDSQSSYLSDRPTMS